MRGIRSCVIFFAILIISLAMEEGEGNPMSLPPPTIRARLMEEFVGRRIWDGIFSDAMRMFFY